MKKATVLTSILLSLIVSLVLVLPSSSFADTSFGEYAEDTGMKLTTGVVNISTGWADFFRGIYELSLEEGPIVGTFAGPIYGVGKTIIRTGSGVYDTATFLVPIPDRYRLKMEPEFVWQDLK
ncbi:MAG: exosortase system-associated protein, TIGR04073 family [Nitrospiria bacterium]